MTRERKINYSVIIEGKIKAAQDRLKNLEHARNTSESAMTSRYDTQRESFAREVNLQEDTLRRLLSFRAFLENCEPNTKVSEGAEFTIKFSNIDDKIERALFCPIMVGLDGVQIITPKSPIGKATQGLKDGESFSYKLGSDNVTGVIKNIE